MSFKLDVRLIPTKLAARIAGILPFTGLWDKEEFKLLGYTETFEPRFNGARYGEIGFWCDHIEITPQLVIGAVQGAFNDLDYRELNARIDARDKKKAAEEAQAIADAAAEASAREAAEERKAEEAAREAKIKANATRVKEVNAQIANCDQNLAAASAAYTDWNNRKKALQAELLELAPR